MRGYGWMNGDKADIVTGHKGFDAEITAPGVGNVIADHQTSGFVRPRTETACNGQEFPVGHLREFDLQPYREMPSHVRKAVEAATEGTAAILYRWQHHDVGRVVHGYTLTRTGDQFYERIASFVTGPSRKSEDVVLKMAEYVSNPPGVAERVRSEVIPAAVARMTEVLDGTDPEAAALIRRISALTVANVEPGRGDTWRVLEAISEGRIPPAQATKVAFAACGDAMAEAEPNALEAARKALVAIQEIADGLRREFGHEAIFAASEGFANLSSDPDHGLAIPGGPGR